MSLGALGDNPIPRAALSPSVAERQSRADEWAATFAKEAKKTPFERIRDSILARHRLTKEQFDALPKAERNAIEEEIRAAIKRAFGVSEPTKSGVDVTI